MRYANKHLVNAFKITGVEGNLLTGEDNEASVSNEWIGQNEPKVGDYYIESHDRGPHTMSAGAFEDTYMEVESINVGGGEPDTPVDDVDDPDDSLTDPA